MNANEPDPAVMHQWRQASSVHDQIAVVLTMFTTRYSTASSRRRLGDLAVRFATRLAATGVVSLTDATFDDCEGYVWAVTRRGANPSPHTMHLRRTTLRAIYQCVETLQPGFVDPSRRLPLPDKGGRRARPLTDGELDLLRTAALGRSRQPLRAAAAVALGEAAASSSEIAHVRWADIDLTERVVHLPGATPIQPRTTPLTTWGTGVLHRWHTTTNPTPDNHVLTRRHPDMAAHTAQVAVNQLFDRLFDDAGLDTTAGITAASIRLWAGRHALTSHGIEHAARTLGLDSLDTTANTLDHQWRTR